MVVATRTDRVVQAPAAAWHGKVALIAKPDVPGTGVGRYAHTLYNGLRDANVDVARVSPALPPFPMAGYHAFQRLGMDLPAFFRNYPIWAHYSAADVYHFTSQNLATLLVFRRPSGKTVVSVHDIIPYMLRNDPELKTYRTAADRLFDRLAMAGLRQADYLIASSVYTKQCLIDYLHIAPHKIVVVYLGIDLQHFQPVPTSAMIRERYQLPDGRRYLIYVGSEDPRKNLAVLVRALAQVRCVLPDVELIKVGRAHFMQERQRLTELAAQLGILSAIHFLEIVPEADLPSLYRLADVCVMPSLYEGFGFPLLEAQACGVPVVYAGLGALAELAGDVGKPVDPHSADDLAVTLLGLLKDEKERLCQSQAGLIRAAAFSWEHTIHGTTGVYSATAAQAARNV